MNTISLEQYIAMKAEKDPYLNGENIREIKPLTIDPLPDGLEIYDCSTGEQVLKPEYTYDTDVAIYQKPDSFGTGYHPLQKPAVGLPTYAPGTETLPERMSAPASCGCLNSETCCCLEAYIEDLLTRCDSCDGFHGDESQVGSVYMTEEGVINPTQPLMNPIPPLGLPIREKTIYDLDNTVVDFKREYYQDENTNSFYPKPPLM